MEEDTTYFPPSSSRLPPTTNMYTYIVLLNFKRMSQSSGEYFSEDIIKKKKLIKIAFFLLPLQGSFKWTVERDSQLNPVHENLDWILVRGMFKSYK